MARERHVPGELPWGWWLRARDGALEDEDGRTWRSVREAFWQGELGFPDVHFFGEQHELMLRTLSSLANTQSDGAESMHDLFGGDMMFWRFYMCWLASVGMLGDSGPPGLPCSPLDRRLSPEGISVLMMLRATREPAWERLLMADVIDAVASSLRQPGHDERERALRTFEGSIGLRRHVFARERVARSHLVTLTGFASGPGSCMPTRRVTWSQAFTDASTRDDLFAWLALRVERWDDWGEMAYVRGANAFGRHLLELLVASRMYCPAS